MALWRCRVPSGEHGVDTEEAGVVVDAETMEQAQTLAKREIEFEEVLVDSQGRTIRFEIKDIVCEMIDEE